MANTLIGVDINAIELVMVNNKGEVNKAKMPANLVNNEGIVSPESLAQFIKETKKANKINGKDCAIILPDDSTYFRTVETPIISDAQLKLNLPFEFKDFTGVDSINYNYDYMVNEVEKDDNGKATALHLYAAAAKKDTIDEYQRIFKKAGLKLKRALPNEVCVLNLMKKTAKEDQEYCLVGVEYDFTRIYIFKGNKLRASKLISIGNHDIDKIIARHENTDEYLAADLRDNNHEDILASDYLKTIYENISLEIMKTINFYRYEHNDSKLDTIYFFSMGAANEALCDSISKFIDFKKGQASDIMPSEFKDERALLVAGLIL